MFEDLIEKLKASVEELKKKLPGKGGDDDEYEEDDFDEDEYEEKYHGDSDDEEDDDDGKTVKVQVTDLLARDEVPKGTKEKTEKIQTKNLEDDEDDDEDFEDDDEDEDEDDEAKAQKRKKLITYGAVFSILILVGWDYIFPPEPEVPAPIKRPKKRKKRKKRKFPKKKVEAPAAETKAPVKEEPKAAPAPKIADIPPETAVGVAPKIEEAPKPVEEPKVEPVAVADPVIEPKNEIVEPKKEVVEQAPVEDVSLKMGEVKTEPEVAPVKNVSASKADIESKIEKKLEYVAPPNYERSGRGLVYNCIGKHWACVDKFSYLTCRENSVWSKQNDKKPECAIKNVYASSDDCGEIQKHYIETSEATAFCDGVSAESNEDVSEEASTSSDGEDDLQLLE